VKFTLKPGAELDILTAAELREVMRERWTDFEQDAPVTFRAPLSDKTNASGGATVEVLRVPAGRRFKLTRLLVWLDGFTPADPYQDDAAYMVIRREGGQRTDFLPLTSASGYGLPAVFTDGDAQAAEFVNGEVIQVEFVGLPANTTLTVYAQGQLQALAPDVTAES
jgi:hypothetical protein